MEGDRKVMILGLGSIGVLFIALFASTGMSGLSSQQASMLTYTVLIRYKTQEVQPIDGKTSGYAGTSFTDTSNRQVESIDILLFASVNYDGAVSSIKGKSEWDAILLPKQDQWTMAKGTLIQSREIPKPTSLPDSVWVTLDKISISKEALLSSAAVNGTYVLVTSSYLNWRLNDYPLVSASYLTVDFKIYKTPTTFSITVDNIRIANSKIYTGGL